MAVEVIRVVPAYRSAQYDGTNGDELVALIPGAALVSDTGTALTLDVNALQWVLAVGEWLVWRDNGITVDLLGTYADALRNEHFVTLPS